ncbi:MAG: NuoM family protein [Acidimicrobiia bacterium]
METFDNGAGLSLIVFLPLVGMVLILITPRARENAMKGTALLFTGGSFLLSLVAVSRFDYKQADEFQLGTNQAWIQAISARFHIGVDGISLPLVVLSTFVTFLCVIYTLKHAEEPHNPKAFLSLILLLAVGMAGTFVALDLVLFFVFFELVLLPMYFLVGIWGDRFKRRLPGFDREVEMRLYAAIKFFLFTLLGSVFMLLGFIGLFVIAGTWQIPELIAGGEGIFESTVNLLGWEPKVAFLIFAGLFLGFAVKVPMWPLHTWLPDAHTAAPTVGSVLLAAILLKLGAYGFIRISLPILPGQAGDWAPFIAVLAVIAIIYGALACLAQRDLKRLIAFSSVGHMGFVMLGIATLTATGLNAAVIGMVAHGVITGLLFFLAGSMHHRYHTREMARLGGNLKLMPVMGGILAFTAMASLGLPGLAGFWGEFMALLGAYEPAEFLSQNLFRTAMVLGAIGTVLTAGYMLWMLQRVNLGEPSEEWAGTSFEDVDRFEMASWAPLVVAIAVIGVFPGIVFTLTNPAVESLVQVFGG